MGILSSNKVMNSSETSTDRSTPRWAGDAAADAPPTAFERTVLAEVLRAIRRVRHGSVQLSLQDGRVVQVDITEKRRL